MSDWNEQEELKRLRADNAKLLSDNQKLRFALNQIRSKAVGAQEERAYWSERDRQINGTGSEFS